MPKVGGWMGTPKRVWVEDGMRMGTWPGKGEAFYTPPLHEIMK